MRDVERESYTSRICRRMVSTIVEERRVSVFLLESKAIISRSKAAERDRAVWSECDRGFQTSRLSSHARRFEGFRRYAVTHTRSGISVFYIGFLRLSA